MPEVRQLLADYLERAAQLEKLAESELDSEFKAELLKQARALLIAIDG